ncbi:MAG: cytochrome c3 family protein [Gemmatimonadota bacterium]|nr:MAG: cytochrome c3 family protein [Gemmatimonadota bacterium]
MIAAARFVICGIFLAPAALPLQAVALLQSPVAAQQRDFTIDPDYSCVTCHTEKRRAFLLGTHSERGIRCHDCHGGDPRAFEQATAHTGPEYVGPLDKMATVQLCSSCHSDPDQMRQYGLPVGELAEYRTSRHGQLLLEQRDYNAPTCTDCHDAHTILPPNDARSNVYPTNIAHTCARCHEDAAMMGEYGLGTDQIETHRASAHGVALYQRQDFAAPTCVSCHGSHAALPPAVTQIADVCGHCHVLVRRAFYAGPHGRAAQSRDLPGCTACHSNHGTERIQPNRIAATCTECHEADSPAALAGLEIQEDATRTTVELHAAEEAIQALARAGRTVADVKLRYQTAVTAYNQISQAQHSLDLEVLEDLSRQVSSISRDVRAAEEVAAEHRWEHGLALIPIWFLALSATVLAWFKLRALRRERR